MPSLRIGISLWLIGGADLFRKPVSTFRDRALIVDHPAVDVLADDACIAVDGRIPHGRVFDSHGAVEARIDDGRLRYARGAVDRRAGGGGVLDPRGAIDRPAVDESFPGYVGIAVPRRAVDDARIAVDRRCPAHD